jgi:hypothetical protein
MTTLKEEEGTVNKKDSKSNPPNPKPTPTRAEPIRSFPVMFDFLSWSSFENNGFLLH